MTLANTPKGFNWVNGIFIIGYHVGLIVGLPFYFAHNRPSLTLIVVSAVLLVLTEIGIGAAYHRFYSHRAYKLNRAVEAVLLFLATLATQGSAMTWSHDHRRHHAFVDTDEDPYSIKKGFWYAHMLWLFEKPGKIDPRWVKDLLANPLVRFQHKFAGTLSVVSNLLLFLVVGSLLGDFLGAFVITWWTRLAVSHHLTWCINSLAHCWGARTYSREHTAVDNYVVALVTVGEGYHNFHHTFPSDYRNGVRWYHFDPTKWTIWTLSKLGLARSLKRVSAVRIEKRLLQEDRRLLIDRLRETMQEKKADLERRVEQLAGCIQEKLSRQRTLTDQINRLKVESGSRRAARAAVRSVRRELKAIRQSLREDWKAWHRLSETVLATPAPA